MIKKTIVVENKSDSPFVVTINNCYSCPHSSTLFDEGTTIPVDGVSKCKVICLLCEKTITRGCFPYEILNHLSIPDFCPLP